MTVLPKERRPTSDIIYEQPTLCKNVERIAREYLLVPVEKSTFDHCFLKLSWNQWLGRWCFTGKCVTAVSSVAQSCPTLCDPMNRSTPDLPVHHQLLEFTQTHVHWVSDAIQPSHPLPSPSPPAPNPSQHQGVFQWVNSLNEVAKVLEFQLQHLTASEVLTD